MPDDIVTRLLERCDGGGMTREVMREAAAEIERLRNDISTLEKEIAMVVPCHHKDGRRA